MTRNLRNRVVLPLVGLCLVAVAAFEMRAAVTPSGKSGGKHASAALPPPSTHVAAEGRIVAYPGAEVVVGTDLGGTIVSLKVQERRRSGAASCWPSCDRTTIARRWTKPARAWSRRMPTSGSRRPRWNGPAPSGTRRSDPNRRSTRPSATRTPPARAARPRLPPRRASKRSSPRRGSFPRSTASSSRGRPRPERPSSRARRS